MFQLFLVLARFVLGTWGLTVVGASTGWRWVMRTSTITISCAPMLALLSGKQDLEGKQRRRAQDRGKAGAGKSTLNRLELTPAKAGAQSRYKKMLDTGAADRLLTSLYIQSQPCQPERIVLDLDATDDALHGRQEGRFFHGYYGPIATCRSTFSPGTSCSYADSGGRTAG